MSFLFIISITLKRWQRVCQRIKKSSKTNRNSMTIDQWCVSVCVCCKNSTLCHHFGRKLCIQNCYFKVSFDVGIHFVHFPIIIYQARTKKKSHAKHIVSMIHLCALPQIRKLNTPTTIVL